MEWLGAPGGGAGVCRLVWSGQLGGAAAAIRERRPPERSREFVRAGWNTLYGASRHDDAGLPSVPSERDRLSEDGRHQRLLPAGTRDAVPAGTDSVAGTHTRRHGADGRSVDPIVGLRRVGVA